MSEKERSARAREELVRLLNSPMADFQITVTYCDSQSERGTAPHIEAEYASLLERTPREIAHSCRQRIRQKFPDGQTSLDESGASRTVPGRSFEHRNYVGAYAIKERIWLVCDHLQGAADQGNIAGAEICIHIKKNSFL